MLPAAEEALRQLRELNPSPEELSHVLLCRNPF
jgi:hypothetical protein